MNKATIIKIDRTEEVLDHRPTLAEAQKIVGGYIQFVALSSNKRLVVDDEGKIKNKPVNTVVTAKYGHEIYGGFIVGDVILLEGWKTVG